MPESKKAAPKPRYPSYAEIVAELRAKDELPPMQWVPQQPPNPGYAYQTSDPLAQAAHFAARQEAARQLSSPVSPVLELPEDAHRVAPSLVDQLINFWRTKRKAP